MKKAIFSIVKSQEQANTILNALKTAGFYENDVSVLFADPRFSHRAGPNARTSEYEHLDTTRSDQKKTRDFEKTAKAGHRSEASETSGRTSSFLADFETLAVPGAGPFLAAGPLLATLSRSATGGSLGLIASGLIALGVPDAEAKRYEGVLKTGGILLSVHCEDSETCEEAKRIFEKNRAEEISYSREKSTRR